MNLQSDADRVNVTWEPDRGPVCTRGAGTDGHSLTCCCGVTARVLPSFCKIMSVQRDLSSLIRPEEGVLEDRVRKMCEVS